MRTAPSATRRPLRSAAVLATVSAVLSAGAVALVPTAAQAAPRPLMISPTGAGNHDGSSWANAGSLADLPRFVASRRSGGQIWLRGDAGAYKVTSSVALKTGGSAAAPVVIRGVAADGSARAVPVLVGNRTAPYRKDGTKGREVFKLYTGAAHLSFSNLSFRNVGTAFTLGGNSSKVSISDMTATNVRRFFENHKAGGESTANLSDIALRRITVRGFSKSVARVQYDSRRVLLEDVHGDSQAQDGDDFAMGVHIDDTAHDITLRRVTMRNSRDTLHSYWNGDGFATERGVYRVRFEDTAATGSTDGGYDLKSRSTTLVRATASGNKRNYRFWAPDTVVAGCTGSAPVKRGGSGSQAQVWLGAAAKVVMRDCTLTDSSAATTVFELENDASLTVERGKVVRAAGGKASQVESRASLRLVGTGTSSARPAAKPAAKPAARPAAKPAPKPAARPAAKPAPKPAVKPAPVRVAGVFRPAVVRLGGTTTLSVDATVAAKGRTAVRQQLVAGRWITVSTTVLDAAGRASIAVTPTSRGAKTYRIAVLAAGSAPTAHSGALRVDVV